VLTRADTLVDRPALTVIRTGQPRRRPESALQRRPRSSRPCVGHIAPTIVAVGDDGPTPVRGIHIVSRTENGGYVLEARMESGRVVASAVTPPPSVRAYGRRSLGVHRALWRALDLIDEEGRTPARARRTRPSASRPDAT
jgi:hypothetical protein